MRRTMLCLLLCGCDDGTQPLNTTTTDAARLDGAAGDARLDAALADAARQPDAAPADAAPDASSPRDAAPDARPGDTAVADAAMVDAAGSDAAVADAAVADAMVEADASVADAALEPDAAPLDAAMADAAPPPAAPNHGLDDFPFRCADPAWRPPACAPGVGEFHESIGAQHIPDDQDIPPYALNPPSSGPHRGRWGRWGEYVSLPPERWLHNLEHGGIAVLYHPCAPPAVIQGLRDLVRARPEGEALRWVMTPAADLPSTVALVAWEWRYVAPCLNPEELNLFIDRYHAQGPEDVAADGGYVEGWIGR